MVEVYRKASGLVGIEFFFLCVCVYWGGELQENGICVWCGD